MNDDKKCLKLLFENCQMNIVVISHNSNLKLIVTAPYKKPTTACKRQNRVRVIIPKKGLLKLKM